MKLRIVAITMLMTACLMSHAQEMVMVQHAGVPEADPKSVKVAPRFEFMGFRLADEMQQLKTALVSPHVFGDEIARKMFLLNQGYTYETPVAPGSSATKTMYTKPVIYNSVKKIERDLKKKVKSGEVAASLAVSEFSTVLDIALNVVNQNTLALEERLSSLNGSDALLEVYLKEVKLNWAN